MHRLIASTIHQKEETLTLVEKRRLNNLALKKAEKNLWFFFERVNIKSLIARKSFWLTLLLTITCGVIIGVMSWLFLNSLSIVGYFQEHYAFTICLIPLAGLLTAVIYTKFGKGAHRGNNLIIESVNEKADVPLRMAFLAFFFTILTHFSGGSAGREGTAVQMGGSITNKVTKRFHLTDKHRELLILSGISAGFGSVFGTPLAGVFFGMEVCYVGKLRYDALLHCMLSSFIASTVTYILGVSHDSHIINVIPAVTPQFIGIILFAAVIFGITGKLFAITIHKLKGLYGKIFVNYLLRALVSSCIVLFAFLVLNGVRYTGLSTWLIDAGFNGTVQPYDPIMKFGFTSLTLGAGFQGGEVTPLFDIGASLGGWIGQISGVEPSLLAALGLIAVFGCATNTPITTVILGVELFGVQALPYYVIVTVISYYVSGHSSIYSSQIVITSKKLLSKEHVGLRLDALPKRRGNVLRKLFYKEKKT